MQSPETPVKDSFLVIYTASYRNIPDHIGPTSEAQTEFSFRCSNL